MIHTIRASIFFIVGFMLQLGFIVTGLVVTFNPLDTYGDL